MVPCSLQECPSDLLRLVQQQVPDDPDGRRVYLNHTGNSTLSKAGTGDVLSGMLGALLGQGLDRFDAACLAVRLHGRAGELAGQKLGMRCALAREIVDAIAGAVAEEEQRR